MNDNMSNIAMMCFTFMIIIFIIIGERKYGAKEYKRINTVYGGDVGKRFIDTQNGRFYQYETEYSIDDCMGLLSRKNIYDICDYSFEKKDEHTAELMMKFSKGQIMRFHANRIDRSHIIGVGLIGVARTLFRMEFERREKTIITMRFMSEAYILQSPATPIMYMDEFMEKKLSARWIDVYKKI